MAWATPKDWVADELVDEADLNQHIRDNMNHLKTTIDTTTGKITGLSSATLTDLSGANLTGVAKTALNNTFTAGNHNFNGGSTTRLILPVGADKWSLV